ncbi:MAG TPA: MFS transporter [Spirochaetia bacterium]|nr:MFS transporter [Spirochaetia bacterium]
MSEFELRNQPSEIRHNTREIILLLIISFFYWISMYIYMPTLPTFIATKTPSLTMVGMVLSMFGLTQALIRLPLGIASDASGRGKPFIVMGLAMGSIGAFLMTLEGGVGVLALGRALSGLAAATWVPLIVVFSGLFPPDRIVFATTLLTLSGSVGRVLATGLTGYFNRIGGYSLAFYLAAIACLLALAIMFGLRIERRTPRKPSWKGLFGLLTKGEVILPTLINTVAIFGNWAVTFGFLPILAEQMGAEDTVKGMLMSVYVLATILGNMTNTRLSRRFKLGVLLLACFFLQCFGMAIAALAPTVFLLFVSSFLMGAANGITYPTLMALSIQSIERSQQMTAMGLHQAVYSVGMFTGPWIGGILADGMGIRAMFGIVAGFCLAFGSALILYHFARKKLSR